MRVLVTGGAGFIGSAVVAELLRYGHEPVVIDSMRDDVHGVGSAGAVLEHGSPLSLAELIVADVRDEAAVNRAVASVDVVVHLAAKVGLGVDLGDLDDYVSSNDLGTAVLLQAMARAGARRLVLAGSMVVYGEGAYRCAEHGPIAPGARLAHDLAAGRFEPPCPLCARPLEPGLVMEEAAADPRNGYAATKLHQEHLAAVWARETGGSAASMRFHNVYGPGMPRNTPYAGVAAIFRSALAQGRAPIVLEDGAQRRDFVHVTDVARAVLAAVMVGEAGLLADEAGLLADEAGLLADEAGLLADEAGVLVGQAAALSGEIGGGSASSPGLGAGLPAFRAYNVGSGRVGTIGELATMLADTMGGPAPVVTGGYRLGDVRHVTASSERAARELGWRARVPLADGVREFALAPMRG